MSFFNRRKDNDDFEQNGYDNNFDRDYEVNTGGVNHNGIPQSGHPKYNNDNVVNRRDAYGRQDAFPQQRDYGANYRNDNYRQSQQRYNNDIAPSSREAYTRGISNGAYFNPNYDNYGVQNPAQQSIPNPYQPQQNVANPKENIAGYNIVVSTPHNFQDVKSLIISLRNNQSVIVDIGNIVESDAYRIMDYLSGAIFALNGSIQKIAKNMYALAPHGASIQIPHDIQNRMKEDNK